MKNIITITCSMFFSFYAFCQSPITLTRADLPCPAAGCGEDSVLFTNVVIATNSVDLSLTGANLAWSHPDLGTLSTAYQKFIPVSSTPFVFQLTFLGSDYATPLLGNLAIAGLPISDAYEYYNYASNNTRLEIRGFGANITIPTQSVSFPLPAIYNNPDVIYKFPITFGDTDSSNSGFSITIPPTGTALGTLKRQQTRKNAVDAWGSVTTPAGTFDVLRIKSNINRVDSLITSIFPIGIPTNTTEYKWLGQTKKIPVLQVNTNLVGQNPTVTGVTFWGEGPNPITFSNLNNNVLSISPNPAQHSVNIHFGDNHIGKTKVSIINLQGQQVAYFEFLLTQTNQNETIPLFELPQGNYMIQCQSQTGRSNQKLTIY